jgi:hypothetical protein
MNIRWLVTVALLVTSLGSLALGYELHFGVRRSLQLSESAFSILNMRRLINMRSTGFRFHRLPQSKAVSRWP